jgi:hypothetical protein
MFFSDNLVREEYGNFFSGSLEYERVSFDFSDLEVAFDINQNEEPQEEEEK